MNSKRKQKQPFSGNRGTLGTYMAAADAVIGAAVLTVIGVLVGSWLDRQIHTGVLMTLGFMLIGMIGGLVRMVKKVVQAGDSIKPNSSKLKQDSSDEPSD